MIWNDMNQIMQRAFEKSGLLETLPQDAVLLKRSDRPDLSDFQSNAVMPLAKICRQSPRVLAQQVVTALEVVSQDFAKQMGINSIFSKVSIDGPGFINLSVDDQFLTLKTNALCADERFGHDKVTCPRKIIIDYGGPNVAKPLHVGHLRSAVIGESLKRLYRFYGDQVVGDIHLGDWGRPMGLIIAEIARRYPDLPYFDDSFQGDYPEQSPVGVDELAQIYPAASSRAKDDDGFLVQARAATQALQAGHRGYYALWTRFVGVSIADLKLLYHRLDVSFDLWQGESHVHERVKHLIEHLKADQQLIASEGAWVINVAQQNDQMPPLLMEKSDGAILYSSTDLATLEERVDALHADSVLYVVDGRQSLHFEQVFRAARKVNIAAENIELKHVKFGTINGQDGKPFKTRDGGVMQLSELIQIAVDQVMVYLQQQGKDQVFSSVELTDIAEKVGIAAVKFADLMNDRKSDYIFDVQRFACFEGKTGPYILYSLVRIASVLRKAQQTNIHVDHSIALRVPTNVQERELMLLLNRFGLVITQAYQLCCPHILCDFLYDLAQAFSRFYNECQILKHHQLEQQQSWLALLMLVQGQMKLLCHLLGLPLVEKM